MRRSRAERGHPSWRRACRTTVRSQDERSSPPHGWWVCAAPAARGWPTPRRGRRADQRRHRARRRRDGPAARADRSVARLQRAADRPAARRDAEQCHRHRAARRGRSGRRRPDLDHPDRRRPGLRRLPGHVDGRRCHGELPVHRGRRNDRHDHRDDDRTPPPRRWRAAPRRRRRQRRPQRRHRRAMRSPHLPTTTPAWPRHSRSSPAGSRTCPSAPLPGASCSSSSRGRRAWSTCSRRGTCASCGRSLWSARHCSSSARRAVETGSSIGSSLSPSSWTDLTDTTPGIALLARLILVAASGWVAMRPERVIDAATQIPAFAAPTLALVTMGFSREGDSSLGFLAVPQGSSMRSLTRHGSAASCCSPEWCSRGQGKRTSCTRCAASAASPRRR